jgi:hypothetical protein
MYKIYLGLSKEFKEARRNKRSGMWWGDQQLWYWCAFNSLDFLTQRPPIHWKHGLKSIESNSQFILMFYVELWNLVVVHQQMSHKCRLCSFRYSYQFHIRRKIYWLTYMLD